MKKKKKNFPDEKKKKQISVWLQSLFQEFSSTEHWKNQPVSTRSYRFGNPLYGGVLVFELHFIESTLAMFAFHSSRGQLKLPIIPRNFNKVTSTAGYKVACYFIFLPPITRLNKNPAFKTGLTELPILANASLALSTLEGCLFTVNARAIWEQNSTEIPTAWNKRTRQKIKAIVTFKGSLGANNEMRPENKTCAKFWSAVVCTPIL